MPAFALDPAAVRLVILGGMLRAALDRNGTALTEAQWAAVVEGLTPYQAAVVLMRHLHGMGNEGIGRALGLAGGRPEASVHMVYANAMKKLRKRGAGRELAGMIRD